MSLSFKAWLKQHEAVDGVPQTDDEAKIRLPQDVRAQGVYDQLRKKGKKPGVAWNAVIQQQWANKKSMSS